MLRTFINDRPLRVEILGWEEALGRSAAWNDLLSRGLEPNAFLEPAFALTAAQHFNSAGRPSFMLVSMAEPDGGERLIGVCGLDIAGGFSALTRVWRPKQAALGTPLLDRDHGAEALDLMFAWLDREYPRVAGLTFPSLAADGPTAVLIRARAAARGLELHVHDAGKRAVLKNGGDVEAMLRDCVGAKHLKEMRRQRRRLADRGALDYVSAHRREDIGFAAERFLALEASGWKGERGTALLCEPALATFLRAMTRLLVHEGKCRIDGLELDGQPIAMGIVILSGNGAFLWKIAYDEAFAAYSPGVQFMLEFTRRQAADSTIAWTDSCAVPDHPMIDRLWPDRLAMVDISVAVSPRRSVAFRAAIDRDGFVRRARALAKRGYYAMRRRRAS